MDLREKHKSTKAKKQKLCAQIEDLNNGLAKQEKKLAKKMAKVLKLNKKLKKLKQKLRKLAKDKKETKKKDNKKNVKKKSKIKGKKKSKNLPIPATTKSLRKVKKTPKEIVPVPDKSLRKVKKTVKEVVAVNKKKDNLKIIDGIGPKIEKVLNDHGIISYTQLAQNSSETLSDILGDNFQNHQRFNTIIWPEQAMLAAAGKFDVLKELQDKINKQ